MEPGIKVHSPYLYVILPSFTINVLQGIVSLSKASNTSFMSVGFVEWFEIGDGGFGGAG